MIFSDREHPEAETHQGRVIGRARPGRVRGSRALRELWFVLTVLSKRRMGLSIPGKFCVYCEINEHESLFHYYQSAQREDPFKKSVLNMEIGRLVMDIGWFCICSSSKTSACS